MWPWVVDSLIPPHSPGHFGELGASRRELSGDSARPAKLGIERIRTIAETIVTFAGNIGTIAETSDLDEVYAPASFSKHRRLDDRDKVHVTQISKLPSQKARLRKGQ
jgi:hypothetical protein